ncbi:MAG: VUT family protein [Calditrichaeota bacterium]|nr:MAG: VUT family protein [Calditrichota bacterium]MBL1207056.1 VUT family protein [Calditrichota bacterium]NOG46885.1 queuosine precursor transporter [Calditrichota bacterium]
MKSKKEKLFLFLATFFVANAIIAEIIGGKLIVLGDPSFNFLLNFGFFETQVGPFILSVGVFPWPIVFLSTDLINEYFGKRGVRQITNIAVILILYVFVIIFVTMIPDAAKGISPVSDESYSQVLSQSMWIIVGSIIAFLVSQIVDVIVFHIFRRKTGGKMLWARATGSTIVSQLIDSIIILGIAFYLPGKISLSQFLGFAITNYSYKVLIAILITPLIYLGHGMINRYLGKELSDELMETAAKTS